MGGDSPAMGGARPLNDSAPVELTAKILMTAAIVLFIVVIFVLFLHLYAKWVWTRVEDQTPATAPQTTERRHTRRRRRPLILDPVLKGLDPAILAAVPVVVFRPEKFPGGLECAVCLSELLVGEKTRFLPKCSHGFHVDCIDTWFQSHSTCPICRNPVDGDSANSVPTGETIPTDEESSNEVEEQSLNVGNQSSESPYFPTNVLFWGNETQVSSRNAASLEETPSSSSSSPVAAAVADSVMIDIIWPIEGSSSAIPGRFQEEELKSQVTTRLRSLKRLLSRDRRVNPCGPSSSDVEQV